MLGISVSKLGERFSVSRDAVYHHGRFHLTPTQRAAYLTAVHPTAIDLEALAKNEGENLIANLVASRARLQQVIELALELGDLGKCIAAERAVLENLGLLAKLLGQLVTVHEVHHQHSLLVHPDYLELRTVIVEALRQYPEAAKAVSVALHAMETKAAEKITADAKKGKPLLIDAKPLEEAAAC